MIYLVYQSVGHATKDIDVYFLTRLRDSTEHLLENSLSLPSIFFIVIPVLLLIFAI